MDLTLRQQPYEERIFQHLPDYLLIENGNRCSAKIEDICSPEVRAAHLVGRRPKQDLHFVLSPNLPYVFKAFPGVLVRRNQVSFKYFTCGFSASEEGLEQIRNQRWNKRYGFEIYEDLIKPALSELDD
jgi:hypothetical protein